MKKYLISIGIIMICMWFGSEPIQKGINGFLDYDRTFINITNLDEKLNNNEEYFYAIKKSNNKSYIYVDNSYIEGKNEASFFKTLTIIGDSKKEYDFSFSIDRTSSLVIIIKNVNINYTSIGCLFNYKNNGNIDLTLECENVNITTASYFTNTKNLQFGNCKNTKIKSLDVNKEF